MEITSLLQNSGMYNISSVNGSKNTQSTQTTQNTQSDTLKMLFSGEDGVTFSKEGMERSKMPPQKIDFSSMSDEDLTNFITKMQEKTGSIPGVEDGTAASDLTSEQLQSIREQLTEMSSKMEEMRGMGGMRGMGRMQGPPPSPSQDVQEMSNDSLKSLLETIKKDTGSIPGIDNSESTEVSSLSDDQLQSARDAITEMMQKRLEEMSQNMNMSHAISTYQMAGGLSA